jgi:hypothetical protein
MLIMYYFDMDYSTSALAFGRVPLNIGDPRVLSKSGILRHGFQYMFSDAGVFEDIIE